MSRLALSLAVVFFSNVTLTSAKPFVPQDDAEILEVLPAATNSKLRELRKLHADLATQPDNLDMALKVASRDIEIARAESDPRFNGYAEAALAPWLALQRPPNPVLLLRATLRQSVHDFENALIDLNFLIADNSRDAQARLTRATVWQVLGQYDLAAKDCAALAGIVESLVITTCIAGVVSLHGQAAQGAQALRIALDGASMKADPQIRVWALTILAEIHVRLGDAISAEKRFREALAIGRDGYLLGAFSDFLLDASRFEEARELLQNEARIDPLLLRLAIAEKSLGFPAIQGRVDDLSERFQRARMRGDSVHRREEARFALFLGQRPAEALELARANWMVQRETSDARILLETAIAAKAPDAAAPVLEFMRQSGVEDVKLVALAGQINGAKK